nr:MAPEG family protein [uncultured Moraxella sp.]
MGAWLPATNDSIIWAMIIASILPMFFAYLAKFFAEFKTKDNENPREFSAKTTGIASRANAAQQNSYETLPIFLASVIIALLFFVPTVIVSKVAWLYVILRILYGLAYMANWATLRSVLWAVGFACPLFLFYIVIRMS